jgi:hypothetical protein
VPVAAGGLRRAAQSGGRENKGAAPARCTTATIRRTNSLSRDIAYSPQPHGFEGLRRVQLHIQSNLRVLARLEALTG